jgi:hypothetical protein
VACAVGHAVAVVTLRSLGAVGSGRAGLRNPDASLLGSGDAGKALGALAHARVDAERVGATGHLAGIFAISVDTLLGGSGAVVVGGAATDANPTLAGLAGATLTVG